MFSEKNFSEFKFITIVTLGVAVLMGWWWKFTPEGFFGKGVAGFFCFFLIGTSFLAMGLWMSEILSDIIKPVIWKTEKKMVRKLGFRIHWSLGVFLGLIIMVGSIPIGGVIAYFTFDLHSLLNLTGGVWGLLLAWSVICTGLGLGGALFGLHIHIANVKNLGNRPFSI